MLSTQIARWLQTALRTWARLLEKYKRKHLVKWWNRKPRPCQEGSDYDLCPWAAQMDVLHQQCRGSWDANHSWVNPGLAWFKGIVVVGDSFKRKPAISGEDFGQWLGNIIPLDERRVRPASLWAGDPETNNCLSISRVNHSLCRCLCPESGWWLMCAYHGYPKIGWTAIYCHALGRWPSDNLCFLEKKRVKWYKFKII